MKRRLIRLDDSILRLDKFDEREQLLKDKIHECIQAKSELDHDTGCVIYTGFWEANGQAKIRVGGRVCNLARVTAWLYLEGFRIYGPERAVRTCDSPACCNADHLIVVGDQAQAMRAQRAAGRLGHGTHRLTRVQADQIRTDHAGGDSMEVLAARNGIGVPAVRAVVLFRTWAPKEIAG